MIKCWDVECKEYDDAFIKSNHLIRAELSRNKIGYKTFLGYSYKDVSFIPYVCNEDNRIYPRLGAIKLSRPNNPTELIDEFLYDLNESTRKRKSIKRINSLHNWTTTNKTEQLRPSIKFIMSDCFKGANDGLKRGIFILINEVKRVYGISQARTIVNDWNNRMDSKISTSEIEYRLNRDNYTLSDDYIHKFLESIGFTEKEYKVKA